MKLIIVRIITLILAIFFLFVLVGMTRSDEADDFTAILSRDSGIPNLEVNLSDSMLKLQERSVSELTALLRSFNDGLTSRNEHWDWEKQWDEHWELLYPSWYGGMYINQNQEPVVLVTQLNKEIASFIWETTGNNSILIRKVQHSWGTLCHTQESLWKIFTSSSDFSWYVVGSGVDAINGCIVFTLLYDDNTRAAAMSEKSYSGIDLQEYLVEKLVVAAKTTLGIVDEGMLTFCFTTESPSIASKLPGSRVGKVTSLSSYASLGYRAQWTRPGQTTLSGFVSTGHMTSWNAGDTMYSALNSNPSTTLGTLRQIWRPSSVPGQDDFCFIEATSPSNIIANSSSTTHTAYVSLAVVGMNVNISGTTTGYIESGVVENINRTMNDTANNLNVINLIGLAGTPSFIRPGDSGGIVYNTSNKGVVGIVEGYEYVSFPSYTGYYGYVMSSVIIGNKYSIWPY